LLLPLAIIRKGGAAILLLFVGRASVDAAWKGTSDEPEFKVLLLRRRLASIKL
jgi:hypothetical protein